MADDPERGEQSDEGVVVDEVPNPTSIEPDNLVEDDGDGDPDAVMAGLQVQLDQAKRLAEQLHADNRKLLKDLQEANDAKTRIAADLENFRKRADKAAQALEARTREEVLKTALDVLDNLDRALATPFGAGEAPMRQAVAMVLQTATLNFSFLGLTSFDVKPGEAFDPQRHNAVSLAVATTDAPDGTVAAQLMRGYMLGEKLLRPAYVAVAKAAPLEVSAP